MESAHCADTSKLTGIHTYITESELSGFILHCVRPILNMAYAALRWRWLYATLERQGADVCGSSQQELNASLDSLLTSRPGILLEKKRFFLNGRSISVST